MGATLRAAESAGLDAPRSTATVRAVRLRVQTLITLQPAPVEQVPLVKCEDENGEVEVKNRLPLPPGYPDCRHG